jgi:hypothetical protein
VLGGIVEDSKPSKLEGKKLGNCGIRNLETMIKKLESDGSELQSSQKRI